MRVPKDCPKAFSAQPGQCSRITGWTMNEHEVKAKAHLRYLKRVAAAQKLLRSRKESGSCGTV